MGEPADDNVSSGAMADDRMQTSVPGGIDLAGGPAARRSSHEPQPGPSPKGELSLLEGLVPPLVHKLNNALGGVAGLSDLIARSPGTPGVAEYSTVIGEQSRLALELLATLSDITKAEPEAAEPIDLVQLAHRAERFLAPLAEARATELEVVAAPRSCVISCAPRALLRELVERVAGLLLPLGREGGSRRRARFSIEEGAGRVRLRFLLLGAAEATLQGSESAAHTVCARTRGPWNRTVWTFGQDSPPAVAPATGGGAASGTASTSAAPAAVDYEIPSSHPTPPRPTAGSSIVLLESDLQLADLLESVLREAGHRVGVAVGGDRLEQLAADKEADLVLIESAADGLGSGPDPGLVRAQAQRLEAGGYKVALLGAASPTGWPNLDRPFRPGQLLDFVAEMLTVG